MCVFVYLWLTQRKTLSTKLFQRLVMMRMYVYLCLTQHPTLSTQIFQTLVMMRTPMNFFCTKSWNLNWTLILDIWEQRWQQSCEIDLGNGRAYEDNLSKQIEQICWHNMAAIFAAEVIFILVTLLAAKILCNWFADTKSK